MDQFLEISQHHLDHQQVSDPKLTQKATATCVHQRLEDLLPSRGAATCGVEVKGLPALCCTSYSRSRFTDHFCQ